MVNYLKIKRVAALTALLFCSFWLTQVNEVYAQEIMQKLPADTSVVSTHSITIKGETVPYKVIVGTLPVFGEDGKPDAALQYVYYVRTDVKNKETRPLMISFNGGPGTASLWMHIGYTSPKRLKVSENGWPVQPYGVEDNHYSILDVTDILYVNPVNTGFSRILNDGKKEQFFGVNEDIRYLSAWIDLFVSRYHRWQSPKFLIGESYGSVRVAGLAGALQGRYDMYLNGVILQGNCIDVVQGGNLVTSVLKLPFFSTTAWYYKQLPAELQAMTLDELNAEVNKFTIDTYLPAVVRGGSLSQAEKEAIAEKVAYYGGISKQFVLDYNLLVPVSAFWKELLRDQGKTVGRLDSRYVGIDSKNAGTRPEYSAELTSWENSFAPAMNSYLRDDLGFNLDMRYNVFGPVYPWNDENNRVVEMLRTAMQENPTLHLLNQQGYFDGACDVLTARYTLWQLDRSGKLADRIDFTAYESGHMLYIRDESMIKGNEELRQFIEKSIPEEGEPIKYQDVERVDLGSTQK